MQTSFTLAQLADPDTAEANRILRTCVHCGFCTATCPTYVLLGDELDSPRGRIYLIKDMLESGGPARAEVVRHIDRCLSCLSCMTTCPSGVHYMHLVDHARVHIEETYKRPIVERVTRGMLARLLPSNRAFRWALRAARVGRPLADLFAALGLQSIAAMLRLAPARMPKSQGPERRRLFPPVGPRKARVGLLSGCVSPVIAPAINEAAIRVLTRHGIEVVVPTDACCGALVHHLGRGHEACMAARRQIDAW
ncbi:MAG: 4Fe-4S dicluster domain-containing protein, partial [Xanthobacteraceae bacterium]